MIKADTPNVWEVRRDIGELKTKAVIVYALAWLARLVNVERNLTETQIGEIAADIIEEYGYMKMEELKYVLKQGARKEKIYGRLDYNVVMGWFADYAAERAVCCEDISSQRETQELNQAKPAEGAVTWGEYVNRLWELAAYADPDAVERLSEIADAAPGRARLLSSAERHQKEVDFKRYYYNQYLKNK